MKSFLSAVVLWIAASAAYAQQTVQVVWPFSVSSSHIQMVRGLVDTANSQQSEYQFVVVNKPGAGGSIAAQSVATSKDLQILIGTSSFYIRPLLYKDSHSYDSFSLIHELCSDQPLAIFSKKFKRISDIPTDKSITVGMIPGSITNLVSHAILENNRSVRLVEVHYKGTFEATTDMLAGHLESSVDFIGPNATERFTNQNVNTLGITGVHDRFGMKTFQSQGIKGLEHVTHSVYALVRKDVPENVKQRLAEIFIRAIQNNQSKLFCEQEGGFIPSVSYGRMAQTHATNISRWSALTKNLPKQ